MATTMHAIKAYMPGIKSSGTLDMKSLVMYIAGRTNLNRGTILNMLMEFQEALVYFGAQGMSIKLDGVGTFTPTIQLDGTFGMSYRSDNEIKSKLNDEDRFSGKLKNKDMIGMTQEDLIDRWNLEHPDDKIDIKDKGKPKEK